MRRAWVPLVAASLWACAPHAVVPVVDATKAAADDEAARIAKLREDEEHVLEVIAASDPRFAVRVGGAKEERLHAASVKALANGDADAGIEDGALDFFSFTARARSIEEAEAIVAHTPSFEIDVKTDSTRAADAQLERELLVRLVAEEHARLDEERTLPRSASALVRGLVETWGAPESRHAAELRDARIARRLDEVRASLAGPDASRATLAELDDALDPLERIATPGDYSKTAQAIARLRVALGDAKPRVQEDDASWPRLQAALRVHLGLTSTARDLRAHFEDAERALRAEASARLSGAHLDEHDLAKRADALTLASASCAATVGGSRLRAFPPPPERAPACGALHALADSSGEAGLLAAVIALHDDVVVALWALALHEAHATPGHAIENAHPFFGAQPDREARLLHFAAARPVAAIGAGEIASALETIDVPFAVEWLARGDVPIDIARRMLSRVAPTSSPSAPAAPASPRP